MVSGRKLLLADDSVTIQKVIDLTFSDEGIEVTTVGNGEQAISKLEEVQPDIVLADIFMPGRNGYEVCEHIKRDERFRHIPVMLLVGSFEPFDEAEARRVGADDYLTKPFQSIRQLVSKVSSLLSGGGAASSEDEASTRDLELPEELAEKEREGAGADIHTADTAPLPKELEDKDPSEAAAHLAGHESLDDEMIEARRPNEIAEPEAASAISSETRPTAPLSFSDLKEAGIQTSSEEQPRHLKETVRDLHSAAMNEDILSTEEPQTSYMKNAAAADEALLDLGDIEPPVSMTEADDFILDLQDEAPAAASAPAPQPVMAGSSWSTASAQPAVDSPTQPFAEETPLITSEPSMQAETPAFQEEARAHEAFEAQQSFQPQEAFGNESHGFAETTSAAAVEMPEPVTQEEAQPHGPEVEAAPRTGQITLEQLSPEAIDAIARRAVELLSTKVVEEVAWEVVPQLAELLIKRKLEEEKT
ncbi:MAG: response regulator [Pyrinomonadaceae bacterium]|nr:response regulator [Pyrinomonadaceae bacterium]